MDIKTIKSLFFIYISFIIIENINTKIELSENKVGQIDDYFYELWRSDNSGTVTMTIENKNKFDCSWNSIDNVLFIVGKELANYAPLDKINLDNITVNYDIDFKPVGNSYISVYGFFDTYYDEFYIVDNWDDLRPTYGNNLGTISVDGGVYDIYYYEQIMPPNILGIQKRTQYWSIRKEKRSKGTVSFGEHLKAWLLKGLKYTNILTVSFKVEGYKSSGSANVNNVEININEK